MSNLSTTQKIARAKRSGIVIPFRALKAAEKAEVPYFIACAYLMQESGGGNNVFGHDGGTDGWASGWGKVTRSKYKRYKRGREAGKGSQGVGPMQLTYFSIQDDADKQGGCWRPYINMLVGFRLLKSFRDIEGNWVDAGGRYNGGANWRQIDDAVRYALQIRGRIDEFSKVFNNG